MLMDEQMRLQLQFLGILPMTNKARDALNKVTFVTKGETRIIPRDAYPGNPEEYAVFYRGLQEKVELLKTEQDLTKVEALEDSIRTDLAKVPGKISYEPQ
jgi:hypothetical protein